MSLYGRGRNLNFLEFRNLQAIYNGVDTKGTFDADEDKSSQI